MTAADLRSLLYTYLAILRAPGGGEQINFAIEAHIKKLETMEVYDRGHIHLRDLPGYRESAPRPGRECDEETTD